MSETEDHTLNLYIEATESYEYLETLLTNKQINLSIVLEQLNDCFTKVNNISIMEVSGCKYITSLHQLKVDLKNLMDIILKKMNQPRKVAEVNFPQKIFVFSPFSGNKKQKLDDTKDKKILLAIKNTIEIPKVCGLNEIAGLWEVKKTLKTLAVLPRFQPQLFENRKISNSVLLFGPPGTGKTKLAHALAYEADAILHSVAASDLLSPFIGETEKTIQTLFQYLIDNNNFSILFIDEIDGICKKRNNTEQEHSRRIKTELMSQLSKIENCRNLFVICATNCPWDLDTAILRRFQKRIYIPLPNRANRHELFQLFIKNTPLENIPPESVLELLDKSKGFSGSDLSDLVQHALNIPLTELEDTKVWTSTYDGYYEPVTGQIDVGANIICQDLSEMPPNSVRARAVDFEDLQIAVEIIKATVSQSEIKKFEDFISN